MRGTVAKQLRRYARQIGTTPAGYRGMKRDWSRSNRHERTRDMRTLRSEVTP